METSRTRFIKSLGSIILIGWFLSAQSQPNFDTLLQEGGLIFHPPAGFQPLPIEPDEQLDYEARYMSPDGALEVRYSIRPLRRIEIDYQDPHNAAPAPNDLFPLLFRALTEKLAQDHQVISREYSAEQARRLFRAGWAAVAVFDRVNSSQEALLLAIHQNDRADAYILFICDDLSQQKDRIKSLYQSLQFQSMP